MKLPRFLGGVLCDLLLVCAFFLLGFYVELTERWAKRLDELKA